MASTTPTIQSRGASGPVRSFVTSDTRVVATLDLGAYATGGVPLTLSGDIKGLELRAVAVLTPIIDLGGTPTYIGWDGNASSPKIVATVASTGAQVGNGVDLSGNSVTVEFIYGG